MWMMIKNVVDAQIIKHTANSVILINISLSLMGLA